MNLSNVLNQNAVRVISKETAKDNIFHEIGLIAHRVYGLN